jgi:hypothetical protein
MRSVKAGRVLQELGGANTGGLKLRESSLQKKTLGAFLVGTSCILDI